MIHSVDIDITYYSDVCWIEGILGKHRGECLTGAGVGCCPTEGQGNGGHIHLPGSQTT